ncbi:uncharacterized protein LOC134827292 [Culicoides brevitarsis]|uniref:uncharacterized protein LOC134827292 n=1 Tax=Culicoides brevitarsis TaxID=469753 RepID=UPI00307B120B
MKTILVLFAILVATQATVLPAKDVSLRNSVEDETRVSVSCLVDLGKSIKEHGLNEFGPTYELGKDLLTTSVDLIKNVVKCRRMWHEDMSKWEEIQWKACGASVGAKALYQVARLKPKVEKAVQEDFWVQSLLQLKTCLTSHIEKAKQMNYKELMQIIDDELLE